MPVIYKNHPHTISFVIDELRNLTRELRFAAAEELVHHEDPETRSLSIEIALAINHPLICQFCESLLDDSNWRVRSAVCESAHIANLAIPSCKYLKLIEHDSHEYVRFNAALAITKVGNIADIPEILLLAETVSGTNHEETTVKSVLLRAVEEIQKRNKIDDESEK